MFVLVPHTPYKLNPSDLSGYYYLHKLQYAKVVELSRAISTLVLALAHGLRR